MERGLKREQKEEKSRMESDERLQKRISEIDGHYSMAYVDKLYVNPDSIEWGWEYFWGRQSVRGVPDNPRMAYLGRRGWTAVPPDRHPEFRAGNGLSGTESNNYIYNDGLILLERPVMYGDKEREQIAKHNQMIESSMPGKDNFMSEPSIPVRFMADPKPSRGPSSF